MEHFKFSNDYSIMDVCELNIEKNTGIVILFSQILRSDATGWNYNEHYHSYYELHFCVKGHCSLDIQKKNITFVENEHVLIYPHTPHKFNKISDDSLRLSLAFEINNAVQKPKDKYVFEHNDDYIKSLIDEIISELNTKNIGYNEIIKFHIQKILIDIFRTHAEILPKKSYSSTSAKGAMQKSLTFIKNHLDSRITSQDVADYSNFSAKQMNRIFKSNINMTVTEYIKKERIAIVKDYLETSSLTLKEIALLSGFNSEYHLCKVFREIVGMTTTEYKNLTKQ